MTQRLGLLIMTYGSPESPEEDLEEYLTNIRRGNPPGDDLLEEFQQRYEAIGGSPLTEITRQQAHGAAEILDENLPDTEVIPYVGMRYFHPYIEDTAEEMLNDDLDQVVGIVISPQYSPVLMSDYFDRVQEIWDDHPDPPRLNFVKEWWDNEKYHQSVANKVEETLVDLPSDAPYLLTAHSIPKSVWDRDPDYVDQLQDTADAIADRVDHENWEFAYQSAGHTKEEWLKPDMTDLFPGLADDGHDHVLIAPFQFLADHLEILYDIDIAAKEQAHEEGLEFHRIESLNDDPLLLESLAELAESAREPAPSRG